MQFWFNSNMSVPLVFLFLASYIVKLHNIIFMYNANRCMGTNIRTLNSHMYKNCKSIILYYYTRTMFNVVPVCSHQDNPNSSVMYGSGCLSKSAVVRTSV